VREGRIEKTDTQTHRTTIVTLVAHVRLGLKSVAVLITLDSHYDLDTSWELTQVG